MNEGLHAIGAALLAALLAAVAVRLDQWRAARAAARAAAQLAAAPPPPTPEPAEVAPALPVMVSAEVLGAAQTYLGQLHDVRRDVQKLQEQQKEFDEEQLRSARVQRRHGDQLQAHADRLARLEAAAEPPAPPAPLAELKGDTPS